MPDLIAPDALPLTFQLASLERWETMSSAMAAFSVASPRPARLLSDCERLKEIEEQPSTQRHLRIIAAEMELAAKQPSLPHAARVLLSAAATHTLNAVRWDDGYADVIEAVNTEIARAEEALRRAEAIIRRADDIETAQAIGMLADTLAAFVVGDPLPVETHGPAVTLAPPGRRLACQPIAANAPPAARHHRAVNRRRGDGLLTS